MKETVSSSPSRECTYSFDMPNRNRGCFVGAESLLQLEGETNSLDGRQAGPV